MPPARNFRRPSAGPADTDVQQLQENTVTVSSLSHAPLDPGAM
jgi:hypothetical protein